LDHQDRGGRIPKAHGFHQTITVGVGQSREWIFAHIPATGMIMSIPHMMNHIGINGRADAGMGAMHHGKHSEAMVMAGAIRIR